MASRKRGHGDDQTSSAKKVRRTECEEGEDGDQEMVLYQRPTELDGSQSKDIDSAMYKDAGIIERITLKNFMNHTRLDFKFGSQINFVIGRNGSGKSAVVAALVVGLGGKAAVTNRGSSVKGFIKTGKHVAEISIKLRNRGTDAYEHSKYGDNIIIERKITREGASDYRLKNCKDKLVSNKKEELDRILDQFNIQVDNPIAILNQETSKNFLHSKNPKDRYKFFLKATQLEQMKHDYATANEHKLVTEDTIQRKNKDLVHMQKEVEEWEHKFKNMNALDGLKEQVKELKKNAAWAIVMGKEKELESHEKGLRSETAKLPQLVSKVERAKGEEDKYTQEHKKIQCQLQEINEGAKTLQVDYERTKKLMRDKKLLVRQTESQVRRAKSEVGNHKKDEGDILQRIKELKTSASHDYDAERRERERQIGEWEEKLKALSAQKETTAHQQEQFHASENRAKEELYTARGELKEAQKKLRDVGQHLSNLEASRSNRLQRFGNHVPLTIADIEDAHRQGRFHKKPIGPIGAFIEVKKEEWALGIESCLKSLIHSYCCHDYHDERALQEILRRRYPATFKPSIIVNNFRTEVYDVSRYKAQSRYPTVFDMLSVQEPVVMNTLVNERSIESIVLIEENANARNVMKNNTPRNCTQAFTLTGDQIIKEPTFRSYACYMDKAKYLGKNLDGQMRELKAEKARVTSQVSQLQKTAKEAEDTARNNQLQGKKCVAQVMKISEQESTLQGKVMELKTIEDPAPVDVSTLEDELEELRRQIQAGEDKVKQLMEMLGQQREQFSESEHMYAEVDEKIKGVASSVDPLKEELNAVEDKLENVKATKKHYSDKVKEQEKKVSAATSSYEKCRADVEDSTNKVIEKFGDMTTDKPRLKPLQYYESKIHQIGKQITAKEQETGSSEEITRTYNEKRDAFIEVKKEISKFQNFIKKLSDIMKDRQKQYFDLRQILAVRARWFFITMLNNRGYTGKMSFDHRKEILELQKLNCVEVELEEKIRQLRRSLCNRVNLHFVPRLQELNYSGYLTFDHARQELDIQVQPTSGHVQATNDMRSLSGGERSFSTVCFILSLWEAMESPFRCLDEFDVYMDMVNRRVSMEMMLEEARSQLNRQFIFLTPLDMTQLPVSPAIRIFKMPDPDRGQGVLTNEPQ